MCVVWLHGLPLSCVSTITDYSECLLKSSQLLLRCCKHFLLLVTVVVASGVTLRLPGYTCIPALLSVKAGHVLLTYSLLLYVSLSLSLISLAAIIRVIGIRWCWLNWKGMQTGQQGFSARENRLEESTRDSREAWQRTRSAVTHLAALGLMKLAGFCRKHTNKLQGLMESECYRMLAILEVWCQVRQYTWTKFGKTFK